MFSFLIGIMVTLVTFYIALIYASTAIGLLGFAEAVLVVTAFVFLLYYRGRLRVTIGIPIAVADIGGKVSVQITVQNKSRIPCTKIRYRISSGNQLLGRLRRGWLFGAPVYFGKSIYQDEFYPEHAGNYVFELEKIRVYDLTGLFFIDKKINHKTKGTKAASRRQGGSYCSVQVLPRLHSTAVRMSERIRNFYGDADVYDDFQSGNDKSEVFDVREFREGDRMQSIHWKLSAKSEELLVREDSQPLACPLVFFLDNQSLGRKRNKSVQCMEAYLSVAASLVFSLMDVSCPHYVSWYSEGRRDIVRIRVDDEESYYTFLSYYLVDCCGAAPLALARLYAEKYRYEHPIYQMVLTADLQLSLNQKVIAKFHEKQWTQDLDKLEILL